MNSNELREKLINVLKKEFPTVKYREFTLKSGNIRISSYIPNKNRDKRWMQLDANPQYLSVAMDHSIGDFNLEDLNNFDLQFGLNGSSSGIELLDNNDAIKISFFTNDPFDFSNNEFINFLHKNFQSYLKRVGLI